MEFDKVSMEEAGVVKTLTLEEFMAIPLERRIDLLCQGKFTFLKDGRAISPLQAMRGFGRPG